MNSIYRITKKTGSLMMAAVFAAAVFFAGAISVPQTVYAADQTIDADNIGKLDQNYTGSVVEGTYTTKWGKVWGGNFDTGVNTDSDLAQCSLGAETAGDYPVSKDSVKISAKSAVVLDANNGNIMYEKDMNKKIYPASCTKILTAIVAIENSSLNDTITVTSTDTDLAYNSSHIALDPGEKISMEQALYGLLMCSANDCALAIAENVGGSVSGFSKMMNEKAKEIGCTDSNFVNPDGLFSKKHYTTAHDLALIMNYCVKNKIFERVDSSWRYRMNKTNKSKKRDLWNGHYMIVHKYYYLYGIVGGKTGYINESRFNLITHYQRNGQDLIIVDTRTDSAGEYCRDTQKLIKYIRSNFTVKRIHADKIDVGTVTLKNVGKQGNKRADGKLGSDMYIELPVGTSMSDVHFKFISATGLSEHISKGDSIGTEAAVLNGKVIGTAVVTASKNVGGIFSSITIIAIIVIGILIFLALFFVMALRARKARKHRSKRKVTGGASRVERHRRRY